MVETDDADANDGRERSARITVIGGEGRDGPDVIKAQRGETRLVAVQGQATAHVGGGEEEGRTGLDRDRAGAERRIRALRSEGSEHALVHRDGTTRAAGTGEQGQDPDVIFIQRARSRDWAHHHDGINTGRSRADIERGVLIQDHITGEDFAGIIKGKLRRLGVSPDPLGEGQATPASGTGGRAVINRRVIRDRDVAEVIRVIGINAAGIQDTAREANRWRVDGVRIIRVGADAEVSRGGHRQLARINRDGAGKLRQCPDLRGHRVGSRGGNRNRLTIHDGGHRGASRDTWARERLTHRVQCAIRDDHRRARRRGHVTGVVAGQDQLTRPRLGETGGTDHARKGLDVAVNVDDRFALTDGGARQETRLHTRGDSRLAEDEGRPIRHRRNRGTGRNIQAREGHAGAQSGGARDGDGGAARRRRETRSVSARGGGTKDEGRAIRHRRNRRARGDVRAREGHAGD